MANRAFMNFGHMYANLTMPALISCQITVDSGDPNGCSVISNGYVKSARMNGGNSGDPADGVVVIQLADNYAAMINVMSSITSPLSGTPIVVTAAGAHLVVGRLYTITLVGTTTEDEWHALGLPAGLTPAVGMNFIAQETGEGTGTGEVQVPVSSGISSVEIAPNPQSELGPQGVSNQGSRITLRLLDSAQALTAPEDGSILNLSLLMDNSSVTVDGL